MVRGSIISKIKGHCGMRETKKKKKNLLPLWLYPLAGASRTFAEDVAVYHLKGNKMSFLLLLINLEIKGILQLSHSAVYSE